MRYGGKGDVKRDHISFDVFSPYTIGKMIKANETLKEMQEKTEKTIDEVSVGGAIVRRLILRTSQKYYRAGIHMYLLEKVIEKIEKALTAGKLSDAFAIDQKAVYSQEWIDLGGQLMPKQRLDSLEDDIENGKIAGIGSISQRLNEINHAYRDNEWAWVKNMYQKVFEVDLTQAAKDDIDFAVSEFSKIKTKFLNLVLADAEKEFAELSRRGFGQDGSENDDKEDFRQIRGEYAENKFVVKMKDDVHKLNVRINQLKEQLENM